MIEAKEEPLPHSAFDYSDRVNETARMITEKKRKDGAWICGCVKAPKLWILDPSDLTTGAILGGVLGAVGGAPMGYGVSLCEGFVGAVSSGGSND